MSLKESQTVELKASTGQLSRALESLCAFANTDLGSVYFGIQDDGTLKGQLITDKTFQKVQQTIFNSIEPALYPNIFEKEIDEKQILIVELKNAPDKPYFLNGKAYKRVGTSNVYLSKAEIELLMYERKNPEFQYDRTVVPASEQLLNKDKIKWFFNKAHEERNLPINDSSSSIAKLNIFAGDKPNIAGALAFSDNPTYYLPTAFVKCAVFEGKDKTGRMLDHQDIKEDVFKQINLAENFVLRNIRKSAQVNPDTGRRESRYEVPYRAIREAIANAVAHRDYRISGTIDAAVFDDRIEIWSPGSLPTGMTIELLHQPHASVLRNSTLAELLYLTRYIERWGSGIQNIKTWMMDYNLPQPQFYESGANFITILKRKKTELEGQISIPVGTKLGLGWDHVGTKLGLTRRQAAQILNLCKKPKLILDIMQEFNWRHRTKFRNKFIHPLLENKLIKMTISEKPKSSKQQYVTTQEGLNLLKKIEKGKEQN